MKLRFPAATVRQLALAVLVLCQVASCNSRSESGGPAVSTARKPDMDMKISLPANEFVVTEAVNLQVTFANNGHQAIDIPNPIHEANWQPTFSITGPRGGQIFSARSVLLEDVTPDPKGVEPVLERVEAGAVLQHTIPLHAWLSLVEPGRYEILGQLYWGETAVNSGSVQFTVEPFQLASAALAVDMNTPMSRQITGACLVDRAGQRQLYSLAFTEDRPDLGEVTRPSATRLQAVSYGATEVSAPWANYNRSESFHHWFTWRDGNKLFGRSLLSKTAAEIELAPVPNRIIRPSLMVESGELDVFVIAGEKPELLLVRFLPPDDEDRSVPPKILGRWPIPALPKGACCTLSPRALQNGRRVVLSCQDGDAVVVYHLAIAADGTAGDWQAVRLENAFAIPRIDPAVMVDGQGQSHVAVLIASDPQLHQLAIADIFVNSVGNSQRIPSRTEIGKLAELPRGGAVSFLVTPDAPVRRDWVVLFGDDQVITSNTAEPRKLSHPPVLPLQLLSRKLSAYLLTADERTGLQFENL